MLTISYSVTGKVEELAVNWDEHQPGDGLSRKQLSQRDGYRELDVSSEVDRIVSMVPPGTYLRVTIETVDG